MFNCLKLRYGFDCCFGRIEEFMGSWVNKFVDHTLTAVHYSQRINFTKPSTMCKPIKIPTWGRHLSPAWPCSIFASVSMYVHAQRHVDSAYTEQRSSRSLVCSSTWLRIRARCSCTYARVSAVSVSHGCQKSASLACVTWCHCLHTLCTRTHLCINACIVN